MKKSSSISLIECDQEFGLDPKNILTAMYAPKNHQKNQTELLLLKRQFYNVHF
jgi:hypothetical protein